MPFSGLPVISRNGKCFSNLWLRDQKKIFDGVLDTHLTTKLLFFFSWREEKKRRNRWSKGSIFTVFKSPEWLLFKLDPPGPSQAAADRIPRGERGGAGRKELGGEGKTHSPSLSGSNPQNSQEATDSADTEKWLHNSE